MAKKVIVIGSGIVGASLAFHLARDGANVTVIEKSASVVGQATRNSWAWLNASAGNPPHYAALRLEALSQWRGLSKVHPNLNPNWCGGLMWDLPAPDLCAYVEMRMASGHDAQILSREEITQHEPNLRDVPDYAVFVNSEGAIDPVSAATGFLDAATSLGAKIKTGLCVETLQLKNQTVSLLYDDGTTDTPDEIILAAGAETNALLNSIDLSLPMTAPAGLLVKTKILEPVLKGLIMASNIHVRQLPQGQLLAGSDFGGADPGESPEHTAETVLGNLRKLLKPRLNIQLDQISIGFRPTPADGLPAIGRIAEIRNLYVAVTHSGITLAPAIGSFAAKEILRGDRHTLLQPFQPDRLYA